MIVFDFETYDPCLDTMGPGCVFGKVEILGMGYKLNDLPTQYTTSTSDMRYVLNSTSTWIAHNISYELGIAKYLGLDFRDKVIYCTKVGAYLADNTRKSTSLELLATEVGRSKDQERFGHFVLEEKLYKPRKTKLDPEGLLSATSWAMKNLNIINRINPALLEEYCRSDVDITFDLHAKWAKLLEPGLYNKFSEVNKALVEMRYRGVRIDMKALESNKIELRNLIDKAEEKIVDLVEPFNYRSSKQLSEKLLASGAVLPVTALGNASVSKQVLANCDLPLAEAVLDAKRYKKALNDFLIGLEEYIVDGRVHGEMVLFGARATGRFSHRKPNLAQVPIRDTVIGPLLRSVFVADEGLKWYSLDFSAQEPRLIVHYSVICQMKKVRYKLYDYYENEIGIREFSAPMVYDLAEEYKATPTLDSHTYNMNLINKVTGIGIDRTSTKTIALGKAYGMGLNKLARSLAITVQQAKILEASFFKAAPYLKELDNYCKYTFKEFGHVKTIGGRKIQWDGMLHKALNKKIQGSAADQVCLVLNELYKHNIIPQIVDHDAINLSCDEETALKVKEIMESTLKLEIPMVAECKVGNNWAQAKE